ncbi:MAG: hypothetical protein U1F77_13710 [Kiritimatiellia bacterium]
MTGLTTVNNTVFSNPTGLSAAYVFLTGARPGSTAPATINLNNLAIGHIYLPQVWVNDSRAGTSRTETVWIPAETRSPSITIRRPWREVRDNTRPAVSPPPPPPRPSPSPGAPRPSSTPSNSAM